MWALLAMFGANLLGQVQQKEQIKASNITAKANAKIQDTLTASSNELAAATGALNRFRQSLRNQQIIKAGADTAEAIGKNIGRLADATQTGNLNTRLQASEATGGLLAASSAAGVGGSTIDMLNQVIKSKEARSIQMANDTLAQQTDDSIDQIRRATEQAVLGQDTTIYLDHVTQVKAVPQTQQEPSVWDMLLGAGAATLGSKVGQQQAINVFSGLGSSSANQGQSNPLYNNTAFVKNM